LQGVVHWLGYRTDVPAIMAACDVCILPSESESFGMVLAEAWAAGIPTVASDIGGCREITMASGGGFLAPVDDHRSFAQQVLRMLADPSLARKLGQAGEAWVKAKCNSKAYAARFQELLQHLQ
jgi:glycosyltransferase involved in cell wall biosynthesis